MSDVLLGIAIATTGYFILAFSALGDKFLVTKTFKSPYGYAFWLGIMGLALFLLLPFQFAVPHGTQWLIDISAGATVVMASLFYMRALQYNDVSVTLPLVGVLSIILTGITAFIFIDERLRFAQLFAIVVLIGGFWVLTHEKTGIERQAVVNLLIAALFFAVSNVATKVIVSNQPFISGLAFSRIGGFLVSLGLIVYPATRQAILGSSKGITINMMPFIIINSILVAAGNLIVFFSYNYSSPTIVNALQGSEYALLFVLGFAVTKLWPQLVSEKIEPDILKRKLVGIAVIIIGFVMLAAI